MKRIIAALAAGLVLGGCATTSPTKIGRDTYSVSARVPFAGPTGAKGDAFKSATAFCGKQDKYVQLLTENSYECALHGGCGEAEITFLCLDEKDPRYTANQMRKDNGVSTIENK